MDNETTYYTFQNRTYTDFNYSKYAYAAGTDALYRSDMFRRMQRVELYFYITAAAFVIGLIGNSLTIFVIVANKSMRTVTNYYLLSLAATDLTLLTSKLARAITERYLMTFQICYYFHWIKYSSVYAATLTITAITVERYLAICKPFKTARTLSRFAMSIVAIWAVALLCTYYQVSHLKRHQVWRGCVYQISDVFILYNVYAVAFCFLPMVVMVVLYTLMGVRLLQHSKIQKHVGNERRCNDAELNTIDKATRRTIKMLIAVVAVFYASWSTFFIDELFTVYVLVFLELSLPYVVLYFKVRFVMGYVQFFIFSFALVVNPIIYSIMSTKFRAAFKDVLYRTCGHRRR